MAIADRPRAFVRVSGVQAEDYLQRMVSNDVAALAVGEACDALLLTPKARLIAPLRVFRRGEDDFLLLTEPELGETVRSHLAQFRFAARADIELEEHASTLLIGDGLEPPAGALAVPNTDYGVPAWEVLDPPALEGEELSSEELERLRIEAGTPRFGRELDERVLPAEAGLVDQAVSLTKGCYPGQEPVARLHYRGHANRGLRRLRIDTTEPPAYDAELELDGKVVGRVTSAVPVNGAVHALAYVRVEVPEEAELRVGEAVARALH
jgi:tRNA-modifying protein YgfZ